MCNLRYFLISRNENNNMTSTSKNRHYFIKRTLGRFVQIVIFLFAAFGGFLSHAAPPAQTNPEYIVGLSSFLVLLILLGISAVAARMSVPEQWTRWMIAGISLFVLVVVFGLTYFFLLMELTYPYPPPPDRPVEYHVAGLKLTESAKDFIRENPKTTSPGQLELNLPYEEIWESGSVKSAQMLLIAVYTVLVLSIAAGIFCFLEANMEIHSKSPKRK